ncbi:MAG: hypothetical protein HN411_06215 [Waddliaceae bacterium]|jgi:hypothetical protein|nr:hypothetical protein [Waddliaceae bacterium]MBT3578573.1 hypothetical protein [Waddliaceae bacterium]MBT4444718.1 hypothetical protein [Waddliaceae bacterium]MBT6928683.1 hypothetical protein [Waddliaceae bacterium]MBT7264915.1 hypothetical protein [Waddliaceae bacterium]
MLCDVSTEYKEKTLEDFGITPLKETYSSMGEFATEMFKREDVTANMIFRAMFGMSDNLYGFLKDGSIHVEVSYCGCSPSALEEVLREVDKGNRFVVRLPEGNKGIPSP